MWSSRRWTTCCCCCVGGVKCGWWRATDIGLHLVGSKINFNRRDPGRIFNAVFASSNRSRLIRKENQLCCLSPEGFPRDMQGLLSCTTSWVQADCHNEGNLTCVPWERRGARFSPPPAVERWWVCVRWKTRGARSPPTLEGCFGMCALENA